MNPEVSMRKTPFVWMLVLLSIPRLLPADGEEPGEKPEVKKPATPAPPKPKPPPGPNLSVSSDLSSGSRQHVEAAIAAYKEAEKAEAGRDALLTKAIEKLRNASQNAFKSPVPLYYLGLAYKEKKSLRRARESFEKAVKLNPRFHEALTELADVRLEQKDLKGALGLYEKALEIKPDYTDAIESKARALIQLGSFKEAKIYLEQVQKLDPNDARKEALTMLEGELKGPGWAKTYTSETENYQVLTPISQEFADEISKRAELIRRAYNKVFSDVEKPKRKFPIWVYEDAVAYHKAGGPPMAGGHYSSIFRKLVLFKYPKKEDTFLTLNHEAFHQYLQDYLERAPQWFNEGLGDYFGAFEYVRNGQEQKMYPRPNRWRLQYVKGAIMAGACPPAADLMVMSQREMYGPAMGIHYAQAWGMIYFMLEGNKPQYRTTLVNYFKALAKGQDLNEAFLATFGKIDMARFDREWKGFIKGLSGK
jgi:tetratricopeptide (TPR) repeat protein